MPIGCIDANGAVYTWGYGSYWQLGTGQTLDAGMPQKVPPTPAMITMCAEALPCPGECFVHIAARSRIRTLHFVWQGTCSGLSLALADNFKLIINTGGLQTHPIPSITADTVLPIAKQMDVHSLL